MVEEVEKVTKTVKTKKGKGRMRKAILDLDDIDTISDDELAL